MERFCSSFARRSTSSLSPTSEGSGVEWVEIASALATTRCSGRWPHGSAAFQLEVDFAVGFFWPIVLCIADMAMPTVAHASAYRTLSHTVDRLGVAHLGPAHTRLAIPAAARSRPPPSSWTESARAALREVLAGRVGAGTTERCVVYASALLIWRDECTELPGLIYGSLPRGPPAPIGESPEDRARALIRHVHRHILRDNHAERAALLAFTTAAVRLSGDGEGGTVLAECVGVARVCASHVPCVSCVTAIAQFSRFLPAVYLEFAFEDAWRGDGRS